MNIGARAGEGEGGAVVLLKNKSINQCNSDEFYLYVTYSSGRLCLLLQKCLCLLLQVSMNRIVDIFGKRKNLLCDLYMFSLNSLNCVLILYTQHCIGLHILLTCNRVMVKKS